MSNPTLGEALDDVEARFLYNLPLSELNQADRLFFQIEQAFWYYEDFKADKFSSLPHFANLKKFAVKLFNHCPLLSRMEDKFQELFSDFSAYKSKIPVFGCILLNPKMNKVVLVCDYNSKSWMFPRGKINEKESEYDCAIREVVEEIGFDPRANCKEEDNIMIFQDGKMVKLFIATNIPENTIFSTHTRKEIGDIKFHPLDSLPKNTYSVTPFIAKLKRWISKHSRNLKSPLVKSPVPQSIAKNSISVTKKPRAPSIDKTTPSTAHPSPGTAKRLRNLFDQRNPDTFQSPKGNETPTDFNKGWSINDMFAANSKLTGLSYKYNGNPHEFGSSHPRFVDYRDQSSSTPSRSVLGIAEGTDDFLELHALSQQSLVGHRMMRLERGKEVDDLPPDFTLPTSAFSAVRPRSASNQSQQQQFAYRWTSTKFTPFVFDVADIMSAVDDSLLMSAQEVF